MSKVDPGLYRDRGKAPLRRRTWAPPDLAKQNRETGDA